MMSKEDLLYYLIRGCRKKRKLTREQADNAVDRILADYGDVMYWYQCSFCNHFHLTSKPPDAKLNTEIRKALIEQINTEGLV